MSTTWKFTGPKVALLLVTGFSAGYWVGRSVGSSHWMTVEVVVSAAVGIVGLVSCRKKTPRGYDAVYVSRRRD